MICNILSRNILSNETKFDFTIEKENLTKKLSKHFIHLKNYSYELEKYV